MKEELQCEHTPCMQLGFSKYCSKCGNKIVKDEEPTPPTTNTLREAWEEAHDGYPALPEMICDAAQTAFDEKRLDALVRIVRSIVGRERQRMVEEIEQKGKEMIDSFRCPVHQQKGNDGNWYILPSDHKLCNEGWIAPRGDIAIEHFIRLLNEKKETL